MEFSVMFWGNLRSSSSGSGDDQQPRAKTRPQAYRLLLEAAKYADDNGYAALWIPERHFHPWGGLYPNPAVIAAALAPITKRIRLRAGSVVVPLHHPIRIAEEWAVVDNLSNGRVEISIASGWRADDFVLAPDAYADRREGMFDLLETVQKLWRGEKYVGKNPNGETVEADIYPRPIQAELPAWVTSAGSIRTITTAGGHGFNLLTHLLGQTFEDLEKKIAQYRAYRVRAKLDQGSGKIALMLHTFIGEDRARVKEIVREPLISYLLESADLAIPAKQRAEWDAADATVKAEMMALAFDRYFDTASLMGTPDSCQAIVEKVRDLGVTEICCLVDFGLPAETVLANLKFLTELKDRFGKQ